MAVKGKPDEDCFGSYKPKDDFCLNHCVDEEACKENSVLYQRGITNRGSRGQEERI